MVKQKGLDWTRTILKISERSKTSKASKTANIYLPTIEIDKQKYLIHCKETILFDILIGSRFHNILRISTIFADMSMPIAIPGGICRSRLNY